MVLVTTGVRISPSALHTKNMGSFLRYLLSKHYDVPNVGTGINPEDKDKEMHLLAMLPIIVKWIEADRELTAEDVDVLRRKYPEQFQIGLNTTVQEVIDMNSRYRDSKIYGKHIEILLSERGVRWLSKNYSRFMEFSKSRPK